MNAIAERYVKLVLARRPARRRLRGCVLRSRRSGRPRPSGEKRPLAEIDAEAERLIDAHGRRRRPARTAMSWSSLRHEYLVGSSQALRARVRMLSGAKLTFDEESRALYDAVAPDASRVRTFRPRSTSSTPAAGRRARSSSATTRSGRAFIIPRIGSARVFDAAIAECRRRTLQHVRAAGRRELHGRVRHQQVVERLQLVPGELPQPDSGQHRPADLHRPRRRSRVPRGLSGHHVYNALLEKHLVRDRGWVEMSVYPLFSPQSLIAEGTANYGIEVAFPGDERVGVRARRAVSRPRAWTRTQAAEYYAGAGARRPAVVRGQRGGAAVSERRDRPRRPPSTG